MSYNISDPLLKKSDNPSEKVRKTSGDLYDIKKALFFTTDTVVKEGNTEIVDKKMKTKPNVVKESISYFISEKDD